MPDISSKPRAALASIFHQPRTHVLRPRFSLRLLLLLVTVVCLVVAYAVSHVRHTQYVREQKRLAASSISLAFDVLPAGCETAGVPWAHEPADEFDRPYFDAWRSEMGTESRLHGNHQATWYRVTTPESDSARDELTSVLMNHFAKALSSMGFETTNTPPIEQASHGHRKLVTLTHPVSELEVDMRFVFGRDGFVYVAVDLGSE